MIKLIVKDVPYEAMKAAHDRGIETTVVSSNASTEQVKARITTTLECGDSFLDAVCKWFCEDNDTIPGFGYPWGTLLLYTHDKANNGSSTLELPEAR